MNLEIETEIWLKDEVLIFHEKTSKTLNLSTFLVILQDGDLRGIHWILTKLQLYMLDILKCVSTFISNWLYFFGTLWRRCRKWSTSENDPHGKIRNWSPYKESDPHTNRESDHHILFSKILREHDPHEFC